MQLAELSEITRS